MTLIYIDIENKIYDLIFESFIKIKIKGIISENDKKCMIHNPDYQKCKEIFKENGIRIGIIYKNIFYFGKYPNSFKNKSGITCPNELNINDIFKCLTEIN